MPLTVNNARKLEQAIMSMLPVGYWKLNETSGTTAIDYSGNGRNGTYSGTFTLNQLNGHVQIGATGRVSIADNAAFSIPTFGGFSVWGLFVKNAGSYILTKGGNASAAYEWSLTGAGSANAGVTGHVFSSSGGTLSTGTTSGLSGYQPSIWNALGMSYWDRTTDTPLIGSINGQTAAIVESHTVTSGYADGNSAVQIFARQDQATADYQGYGAHIALFPFFLDAGAYMFLADAARASGYGVPRAA